MRMDCAANTGQNADTGTGHTHGSWFMKFYMHVPCMQMPVRSMPVITATK